MWVISHFGRKRLKLHFKAFTGKVLNSGLVERRDSRSIPLGSWSFLTTLPGFFPSPELGSAGVWQFPFSVLRIIFEKFATQPASSIETTF
jgi:hypothetical protein